MKPTQKSQVRKTAKAMVDDLNAVRAAVLDQQMSAEKRAVFEARLFESWVIDRLAQLEGQMATMAEAVEGLTEKLEAPPKNPRQPVKLAAKVKKKH